MADPAESRFSEPIDVVPEDDPIAIAWSAYVYDDDPQPLIDLGILPESPDPVLAEIFNWDQIQDGIEVLLRKRLGGHDG